ncbi:hypothetical protein ACI65C_011324 [Semiaphis heraclei]
MPDFPPSPVSANLPLLGFLEACFVAVIRLDGSLCSTDSILTIRLENKLYLKQLF